MQIECIRKREGGTKLTLGKSTYHFKPNRAGRHVADVTEKGHLAALLRIAAYEIYDGPEDAPLSVAAPADEPSPAPAAPTPDSAMVEIVEKDGDDEDETDGIVNNGEAPQSAAPIEGAEDAADEEPEPEPERDSALGVPDVPPVPAKDAGGTVDYAALTEAELAAVYKDKIGRDPHPQAKPATLIKKLQAHDAGE